MSVERVEIFTGGKKLAVHERLYGNNTWSLLPDHYLDLIQQRPMSLNSARPIRQWRVALSVGTRHLRTNSPKANLRCGLYDRCKFCLHYNLQSFVPTDQSNLLINGHTRNSR